MWVQLVDRVPLHDIGGDSLVLAAAFFYSLVSLSGLISPTVSVLLPLWAHILRSVIRSMMLYHA